MAVRIPLLRGALEAHRRRARLVPARVLAALAVVYVVAVILLTTGSPPPDRWDIAGNVVLFAPLGFLAALTWPAAAPGLVTAAGFAVAGLVELSQLLLVSGRDPTVNDLVLNTAGTALGWVVGISVVTLLARRAARPGPPLGPPPPARTPSGAPLAAAIGQRARTRRDPRVPLPPARPPRPPRPRRSTHGSPDAARR